VRAAVQYLQQAYIQHGRSVRGRPCRFPAWARRVRDPLLWAGLPDVVARLAESEARNPNRGLDAGIVGKIHDLFGVERFTAGDVAAGIGSGDTVCEERFAELRALLRERRPATAGKNGPQAMGLFFREALRRWFEVDGQRLRLVETTAQGLTRWHVEVSDPLG